MKYWIGVRIREARLKKGWTQEALGALIGFKQSYICKLEQGKKDPGFHKVLLLIRMLDVSLAWLFEGRME